MSVFIIVGIKYNEWKNTVWKGQVVEVEIDRSNILKYEDRQLVLINGKVLGMMDSKQKKIPFGCKIFASLETSKNHVVMTVVDRPIDWLSEFADNKGNDFSADFRDNIYQTSIEKWGIGDIFMNSFGEAISTVYFTGKPTPKKLYEWLIRVGLNEKNIQLETMKKYMDFRKWLIIDCELSDDNYDDEHIKEYEMYLGNVKARQQENEEMSRIDDLERSLQDWEDEKTV